MSGSPQKLVLVGILLGFVMLAVGGCAVPPKKVLTPSAKSRPKEKVRIGGFERSFTVVAKKIKQDTYSRTYEISVTNAKEGTVAIAAVLIGYSAENNNLLADAEQTPSGHERLRPGETHRFVGALPKNKAAEDTAKNTGESLMIGIRAAAAFKGDPYVIYQNEPAEVSRN